LLVKASRLTTACLIAFSWLFLIPASADDPLSIAAQQIADLNSKVGNLTDSKATQDLIDIAENKYELAVAAKAVKDAANESYDSAVQAEATALEEKNLAQSAVDTQTPIVATALQNKNSTKDALDISAINLATANSNLQARQSVIQSSGGNGLNYTVYNLARIWPSYAVPDSVICSGTWNSNAMYLPVCGNRYENIVVKFTGQITVPSWFTTVAFAGYTDDGFKMYINGALAVNNWVEQGARWSAWSPTYDVTQDKTLDVEIWWYNGGGPGSYYLGWTIPGGMTGAGCDYAGNPRVWGQDFSCNLNTFSSGSGATQQQIDAYNAAITAQADAQTDYNNKLAAYNTASTTYTQENNKLLTYNQTLISKTTAYDNAVSNTANALSTKNTASSNYNQAIIDMNNAIDDAWESYNNQFEFEEKQRVAAAIAQAMANQPQPTPEPSIEPTPEPTPEISPEPSPEPSPEQTEQVDPTPEPTTDTTDEETVDPTPTPETSPEPSVEPSSQPEDITPTPEPEPTQDQTEIFDKTKNTPVNSEMANLIADLTNSNTLAKLTPEQALAVSKTLGVAPQELKLVAELAKSDPTIATALEEFGDRANANLDAPMPYTLADAATEVQAEAFLADPLGAVFNVDPLELLSNFSELGMDMTDDQREKAQEVIIPVVIVSQIASTLIGMRR
jgi:hypothetical protein